MTFVGKTWPKVAFLTFILFILYAVTRLINLTELPIFTDEAIYIRWSQIGSRDAAWRFISLTDGKQPMFTWIMMAFLRVIPDPLLAGRLVSVVAGAASVIGIWFLAYELFRSKRTSFIASLLYLLSPFSLMYDRMALYDSWVATFSIWNLYLAILVVRHLRLDIALIFGMTLGAGMLNKTSGFLSLYLLPATLLLFDWGKAGRLRRLMRWLTLAVLAAVVSQALYSVLRLSGMFHMISQKDMVFVYSFKEWLGHPFRFFEGNLRGMFDWLRNYLTTPIFVTSFLPLFLLRRTPIPYYLLYLWWFIPFALLALFGKVLYPRFILFMAMPLLLAAAATIDWILAHLPKPIWILAALIVLFSPSVWTDYFIITNPRFAPIPFADKGQYIDDWPAGWGVKEVNVFLRERSRQGKVTVFTEGTFGLLPYAIEMYLVDNPNVKIRGIWPLPQAIPPEIVTEATDHPTYVVLNQTQVPPSGWPLELIAEYQKGNRPDRKLRLFQVILPMAAKI